MKCPNCGIDNPSSVTVCQCGYDLGTGQAGLGNSLAKQAQEIREEVKKIQTVDPDVPREEVSKVEVDSDVQVDIGKETKPKRGTGAENLLTFFGSLSILFGASWILWSVMGLIEEGITAETLIFYLLSVALLGVLPVAGGMFIFNKAFLIPIEQTIEIRLYTTGNMVAATIFGGPVAFAYLFAQNFRNLGNDRAARNSLLIGIGYTVGLSNAVTSVGLTGGGLSGLLLFVVLTHIMLAGYLVQFYQEFQIKMHLEEGGYKASLGKTIFVVFTTYLLMGVFWGVVFIAAGLIGLLFPQT